MGRNSFNKSRIAGWETRLSASFPELDADAVLSDACAILKSELEKMDDRGSRAIGMHLRRNILPGFACYMALRDNGAREDEAVAFVQAELCRSVERMSNLCRRLSKRKYAFSFVTKALSLALRYAYPKEGWKIQNKLLTKSFASFEMTTCLYCEELSKRGALELCPAFCQTDHASYDPLAPGVIFIRKNTLAGGGRVCDFRFERGRL